MKVSLNWLKELVEYDLPPKELADKLSLTSIGVKDVTSDYLELDLTYNRGDLLSLRGVAREVAAITQSKLLFSDQFSDFPKLPKTPVQIENEELSPVQCVAKIEGLKVDSSPKKWAKKLEDCGMRSVNNSVDVTNLIMLEFGQPLHAFDVRTVKDETIIVRVAKDGEGIITLDNKLRKLSPSDIVLADTEKPLDVAGVMGGKDTEVKDSTNTILLSASMFNPSMVRKTSNKLGLYSEASKRFMHGLTKTNLLQALSAAIKMYKGLGGKLTALTLEGNFQDEERTIQLTQEKIKSLLGIDIPPGRVQSSLQSFGFKLTSHMSSGNTNWEVTPPYYRLDISIEEDVVEEVARMYGYEKIPTAPLDKNLPEKLDQSFYEFIQKLKEACKEVGLTEVSTYSFYSTEVLNNLDWAPDKLKYLLKVANPISSETEYLRLDLWHNLLETVSKNLKHGHKDIAIFELGKVYHPKKNSIPDEHYNLCLALMNGEDNPMAELNHILEKILRSINLKLEIKNKLGWYEKKFFHPNRARLYEKDGKDVGGIGEVHPRIVNKFGIEQRVAVAKLSVEKLF